MSIFLTGSGGCFFTVRGGLYDTGVWQWVNWVGSNTIVASDTTINWHNTSPTTISQPLDNQQLKLNWPLTLWHEILMKKFTFWLGLNLNVEDLFKIFTDQLNSCMLLFKKIFFEIHENHFFFTLTVNNSSKDNFSF